MAFEIVGENPQKRITDSKDLLIQKQGFIRNLEIRPRESKDNLYKFQIRYLDEKDNLIEPSEYYSGFGDFKGVDGDYIIFKYKVNGEYNNIKEIINLKETHEKPTIEDSKKMEEVNDQAKSSGLISDYEGEVTNIPTEPEKLDPTDLGKPYKALLLNGTINLCTRRGTLSEEEIISQFNRFLKLIDD
jgi:hypothetical protein